MNKKDIRRFKIQCETPVLQYVNKDTILIGPNKRKLVNLKPNTMYYVYVIEKIWFEKFRSFIREGYFNSMDFLVTRKFKKPIAPGGYKVKRRLPGCILTDSKNDIISFKQY